MSNTTRKSEITDIVDDANTWVSDKVTLSDVSYSNELIKKQYTCKLTLRLYHLPTSTEITQCAGFNKKDVIKRIKNTIIATFNMSVADIIKQCDVYIPDIVTHCYVLWHSSNHLIPASMTIYAKTYEDIICFLRLYVKTQAHMVANKIHRKQRLSSIAIKIPKNKKIEEMLLAGNHDIVTTNKKAFHNGKMYTVWLDKNEPENAIYVIDHIFMMENVGELNIASSKSVLHNAKQWMQWIRDQNTKRNRKSKYFGSNRYAKIKLYSPDPTGKLLTFLQMHGALIQDIKTTGVV